MANREGGTADALLESNPARALMRGALNDERKRMI